MLRLSASNGEGKDGEKPDDDEEPTPKTVRSELEKKIEKAEATLAKYNDDFLGDGAKGVTAETVTMAQRALDKLCEKEARLDASSAPSCATGVVRKHFLGREGLSSGVSLLRSMQFESC